MNSPFRERIFAPPANLNEFSPRLQEIWHEQMDSWFKAVITEVESNKPKDWHCQFYNPLEIGGAEQQEEKEVSIIWQGFPRTLTVLYGKEAALQKAEMLQKFGGKDAAQITTHPWFDGASQPFMLLYRMQDEYLEWRTDVNPLLLDEDGNPKIQRIVFTCEGPEYWETMARYDPALVLYLYRLHVSPEVEWKDLVFSCNLYKKDSDERLLEGDYNRWNRWNTTHGIMHLTHPSNTLLAEIDLGGQGTVLRKGICGEKYLSDPVSLTCCSKLGKPNRASDPHIGATINLLVQQGYRVSLQIPVGLYIDQWDPRMVTDKNGKPVEDFFRITRGDLGEPDNPDMPSRILRLEYSVPPDRGYVVGDLYVDGKRITSGGQLARHISMKLTGTFLPDKSGANAPLDCLGRGWTNPNTPNFVTIGPIDQGAPELGDEPAFSDFSCSVATTVQTAKSAMHAGPKWRRSYGRVGP